MPPGAIGFIGPSITMRRVADPIFVVALPRSGAAFLAQVLSESPDVVAARGRLDASIAALCRNGEHLTADDATDDVVAVLRTQVEGLSGAARMLDASPANVLRVPFLHAAFPAATFVYVYREPRRTIHALLLDGDLSGVLSVGELGRRWSSATSQLLDDLERLPPQQWMVVAYRMLVEQPAAVASRVAEFSDIRCAATIVAPESFDEPSPSPEIVAELDRIDETTRDVAARATDFFATSPPRSAPTREKAMQMKTEAQAAPFRSIATQSFAGLLERLGISLVVSTYQSGRLILIRADNATTINTHFRMFRSPMGVAVGNGRLAVGTEREVWDYRDQPAVAATLDPPGKHDACLVPRKIHVTGDIRIHEIGFAAGELWIVNTRFSALCTLDEDSSFVPRWRPPFVTHLAAEDRCHLNGMAIVDDRVRYVTAFGATNTAGGWRENKANGGLLLDVDSGEILLRGLSMPHSPRLHDGRFFILESGKGTIASADLRTGRIETIAELPGFTRGLAFAGPFAFVGLSQVRETNVFGGIPLTRRVAERECGVYVIDVRNGEIVAFLRFEGDVREIFDVQVLSARYPELLELTSPLVATSFIIPDQALAELAP